MSAATVGAERRRALPTTIIGLDRFEFACLLVLIAQAFFVLAALLDQGPPAVGRRRPPRLRPAPVLRLDPRGRPPRADRQPLRPRARQPRLPPPRLPDLAAVHDVTGLSIPPRYLGLWKPLAIAAHVPRRAALRAPPAAAPAASATPGCAGAVRGDAGVGARRVDGLGRQPAPVHVRLHLRRDVERPVPVGLPDDRDRGVHCCRSCCSRSSAGAETGARRCSSGPRWARSRDAGCSRGRARRSR